MAWTARPDGSYEFVNRRWAEYTGLSAEDTIGSGWRLPFIPEDRQPFLDKWRASLANGEPLEWEARFRSAANGEYRWVLARSVPLRDEQGKIVRWHGILTTSKIASGRSRAGEIARTRSRSRAHQPREHDGGTGCLDCA